MSLPFPAVATCVMHPAAVLSNGTCPQVLKEIQYVQLYLYLHAWGDQSHLPVHNYDTYLCSRKQRSTIEIVYLCSCELDLWPSAHVSQNPTRERDKITQGQKPCAGIPNDLFKYYVSPITLVCLQIVTVHVHNTW